MKTVFTILLTVAFGIITSINLHAQTFINTNITNDTWTTAGSPYVVTTSITISDSLMIESGVVVQFRTGVRLTVSGGANLIADGVTFTSETTTSRGAWDGIYSDTFYSGTNPNYVGLYSNINISNSTIQYANFGIGTINAPVINGITITPRGTISLTNTTISNSNYGVNVLNGRNSFTLNSVIINNTIRPVRFQGSSDINFTGINNFTGNDLNAVQMAYTSLTDSLSTTGVPNVTYVFEQASNTITVQSQGYQNFGSGSIVKFADNIELQVIGRLIANAAESETITFTSLKDDNIGGDTNGDGVNTNPTRGIWRGIVYLGATYNAENLMNRVQVRWAGQNSGGTFRGGVSTSNSSQTITNSTFSNNQFGFVALNGSTPTLENNTFSTSE